MLRIGIVDDHPAIVLGTSAMLNAQPDMQVLATGANVSDLLNMRLRLDIVLLDLALADGSRVSMNIRRLAPTQAKVIAYTSGDRPQLIREAARAGAIGMIRKTESVLVLADAIRGALRGEVVASEDWASALEGDRAFVSAELSDREKEVLALYASGETAEQVAQQLVLSRETINDHVRRIRAKYAAADRASPTKVDLYRRALEDGLIAPSDLDER